MITEQDIIHSMEQLEKKGLFVSRIRLTERDWEAVGKPKTFRMATVTVGPKSVAMSDPEFYRYADIPFIKKEKTEWRVTLEFIKSIWKRCLKKIWKIF